MRAPIVFFICLLTLLMNACTSDQGQQTAQLPDRVDFNFHVKPILSDRCFTCHGPDDKTRKGNLRLDTEAGAFAALDSLGEHFAIVPGDLNNSLLVSRIQSEDPEEVMPPPESNLTLTPYEIQVLSRWIEQGAEWQSHWAFIPPVKREIPTVSKTSWPLTEIDHFTLARMELEGIEPSATASREKWLRRVSFDLTGLPPSTETIEAFIQDESPAAYEKIVDNLLASPAYGERMTSIWLDAARYADSHGYQDDRPRTMWPWRDWVIEAFNENMPYDSFVVWQLAGDLLPYSGYSHKLATGFNRNHAITQEGGVVNEEYVTEYVADRANTASTAFLGLTMECARCHDHKYDPISQKDYYSLFAFFNGIEERGQINYFDESPSPSIAVEDAELEAMIAFVETKIGSLEQQDADMRQASNPAFQQWLTQNPDLSRSLPPGLISHHRLDQVDELQTQDEVSPDRPANMNTGLREVLEPPILSSGYEGKALEFDGTNFLNLGDVGDFEWYQPFSLGAWIWAPATSEKDAGLIVRRNGEQKRGGYELALTKDRKLRMSLVHNQRGEQIQVQSQARMGSEEWIHVFATSDGSGRAAGIRLFINGELQRPEVLEDELNHKSILNGNDLLAGNWNHRMRTRNDIAGFKGGKLDEIRVYNRELSPIDVLLLSGKSFDNQYPSATVKAQAERDLLLPHFLLYHSPENQHIQAQLWQRRREIQPIPKVMVMQEMETPRESFILARGAYDAPLEKVLPEPPASVLAFPETLPRNRLGLAQWLTDPGNPLTARVMVNRLWQLMFGRGIVATAEDFGSQGALPTHPELLDWMAVSFVESGWDIQATLRQIALSATYRQSAQISPKQLANDPDNLLLARGPNQRLSAEMIRDNALAVSGLLSDSVGGRWVKPYQPPGIWKELANQIGENKYRAGIGTELYRRSLYAYWKRTIPPPTMLTFDASERAVCVVKRQSTSTPLQSLVLLNDPQYVEASRLLATRMLHATEEDQATGLAWGFQALTSRLPTEQELQVLTGLLESELAAFATDPARAAAYLQIGQMAPDPNLDPVELAAWTVVANTLLNLDEAKMKS